MKRIVLACITFFWAVVVVSEALAEAEIKVEEKSAYEFCKVEKEKAPVIYFDDISKEMFCFKCICPKKGECYPVKTDCPDEKNKK